MQIATHLAHVENDRYTATLSTTGSQFRLTWSDTEVWTEDYEELSTALLRFATLVKCAESGFEKFMMHDADEFPAVAVEFFEKILTDE